MKATCPACGWSKDVPEKARGKKGKCPQCNNVFEIGGGEQGGASAYDDNGASARFGEEVAEQFEGKTIDQAETVQTGEAADASLSDSLQGREFEAAATPAVAHAAIPQKFRQYLTDSESVYFASNPSKGALFLSLLGSVLLLLVGIGATVGAGPVGLPILVIGLAGAFVAYLSWKHRYYLITDKRTIVSQGIFNVGVRIVPNQNIQMISIDTGIVDRLLGLNTIEISTASHGGVFGVFIGSGAGSVKLKSIQNANEVLKCYGM